MKVERWFTQIGADKKRRYLKVEWWKESHETSVIKLHTVSGSESFLRLSQNLGRPILFYGSLIV